MNYFDLIIQENVSVMQAIEIINKNGRGIAFVCKERKLIASVSDGDIRRYLLKKGDLNNGVESIAQFNPYYLNIDNAKDASRIMYEKSIAAIPIVDNEMNIVDIRFWMTKDEVVKENINVPLCIMAGGKGVRLKPYTDILPKPLIPVGDVTITEHIMNRFSEYGCNSVSMIVNYKKNFIKAYFSDKEISQNISFEEEEEFLGTGGGIKLLAGKVKETFFMTNCDILVEADYSKILEYHRQKKNIITMVCAKKEITVPYGTVEIAVDGSAIGLKEKPSFTCNTNTGLYVIEPAFFDKIPDHTFIHITDVIQNCIDEKENVGVYLIDDEQWMDMGQLEELEKMKSRMGLS